ncbi:VOC family protein [Lutimaribacter saemankumensis]|uniref:Glyoxalase-like domain-containing protein n=1 Tax=Lutimaribacter saemankumensis TaxID=490829 RepID=A0A1G8MLK7_9RHOB|nr:VOC family protein [Lutimaribacter saemankumensis]SDI68908.1 Glyoxalase-like domain-containing protein [Lutimaribacter saemankumensis]
MLTLDHIAVAAETLEEGRAFVEDLLGTPLLPGGQHAVMGTHNMLLGLEDGIYFELIAIDPDAAPPAFPRWFDLDSFAGPPRLTNWICRVPDLDAALDVLAAGAPLDVVRGDLRWRMGVPADGRLPFDNCHPALIQWQGKLHPMDRLPNSGLRLASLRILHPRADELQALLAPVLDDPRVSCGVSDQPALEAVIETPRGERVLR